MSIESKDADKAHLNYLLDLQTRSPEETELLLANAKQRLPQLKMLLEEMSDRWNYEDPIYRLYHGSFKVYPVQARTQRIVTELQALAPHLTMNEDFLRIVRDGTGKQFDISHNQNWLQHTRPMVEAFFHARHFLAMICKYAEKLSAPPQPLPTGWATVLYLFNLR